jgi:hypothetical protein
MIDPYKKRGLRVVSVQGDIAPYLRKALAS